MALCLLDSQLVANKLSIDRAAQRRVEAELVLSFLHYAVCSSLTHRANKLVWRWRHAYVATARGQHDEVLPVRAATVQAVTSEFDGREGF